MKELVLAILHYYFLFKGCLLNHNVGFNLVISNFLIHFISLILMLQI